MAYGHAGRVLAAIRLLAVQAGNCSPAWRSSTRSSRTGGKRFTVPGAVFIAANLPKTPIAKIAKPALRERVSSPPRE